MTISDFLLEVMVLLAKACATLFVLVGVYLFFVWAPVSAWTDDECLSKGYPRSKVSITLGRYCTNLDGAITVKVDKL